ncbi:MAG: RNA pseudouridine synthase [Methylibium sp.]|nr:RNA pseudouridine synthase [Methylibium sp.]
MPPPYPELPPIYVDEGLIVVDKPADLLTVPGRGEDKQDCAIHRVQQRFNDALIVHRLDMATSGLLLLARGADMQRRLSIAFAQRRVAKRYTAVLAGCLAEACGEVDLPLMPDWPNRPLQKVDLARGKPSLTRWRVLSVDEQVQSTRVALEPVTGRSHQLRLHMQAIGHPILGDPLYASPAQCALAPRLLLHASWLHLPELGLSFDSAAPF